MQKSMVVVFEIKSGSLKNKVLYPKYYSLGQFIGVSQTLLSSLIIKI